MRYDYDGTVESNRDKIRTLYKMVRRNRKQAMEDMHRLFQEIDMTYHELEEETRIALKFAERSVRLSQQEVEG